nr:hypothetical protein [Pandoravirus massiliensis]
MTQQGQGAGPTPTDASTAATPQEDVLLSLMRQAGVPSDIRASFRDIPLSRVFRAFSCAKCARPDGHALCLDDQIDHRRRRWTANGYHDDCSAAGSGDERDNDTQGQSPDMALASAGYEDRSLMGACIRALVPANVVFTIVEAILFIADADATEHVRVCADRQMMARAAPEGGRPAMRLCHPAARDRLRLRAWAWTDTVARQRARSWRSDAHAFGPCWEAVARPCDSPLKALLLGVSADVDNGYCRQIDAAQLARDFHEREDAAARGLSRLKRVDCPYDPRIVGFIDSPFWSDQPTLFNVHIADDPTFVIAAEW